MCEQRQQRIQRERLVEEFSKALTSFQSAQRQEKVKEKQSNVRANRPPSASYVSLLLLIYSNNYNSCTGRYKKLATNFQNLVRYSASFRILSLTHSAVKSM